jgi:hypothetical protein
VDLSRGRRGIKDQQLQVKYFLGVVVFLGVLFRISLKNHNISESDEYVRNGLVGINGRRF